MKADLSLLKKILFMLTRAQFKMMAGRIKYRLYSDTISYGMRRDLDAPLTDPELTIPVTIRPIREEEVPIIFNPDDRRLTDQEREEIMARLLLLRARLPTCYVAVTDDGIPCFAGWLFNYNHREKVKQYFQSGFPDLQPDEALFEFAYTHPSYRGMHIMPHAMAKIAEKGRDHGARWVLAFADHRNDSSIRRCKLAGFDVYLKKKESCRLFRRSVRFEPMTRSDAELKLLIEGAHGGNTTRTNLSFPNASIGNPEQSVSVKGMPRSGSPLEARGDDTFHDVATPPVADT